MLRKGEIIDEGTQEDIIYHTKKLHNLNCAVNVVWVITYRGITHV
jgi:hypothetical protein